MTIRVIKSGSGAVEGRAKTPLLQYPLEKIIYDSLTMRLLERTMYLQQFENEDSEENDEYKS